MREGRRRPAGVMGNAQTHCVQLPNTFAFARGATGKPVTEADYVAFADDLIVGQGQTIVASLESTGWGGPGGEARSGGESSKYCPGGNCPQVV